eukprot:gnl/TRDRNA2_/TRDRNA2_197885_c0_seq1.p1 gnl/TRDRNA2_/TRDRNA2_197885_c0~~gnl/TRDRNA2_/TRDRNA2_197885_c0_seq1.p1  ORF type:complete len:265 (+),score=74.13 gnl/TRDRNA2_/TRDRNA2_197885_c0_seq1:130-924(+)
MAELAPYLDEFKTWYTAVDGFGEYLLHFIMNYGGFFKERQETHEFVYTKLHREFSDNLEAAVDVWRTSKGLSEEHMAAMLEYGQQIGDVHTTGIIAALHQMLEYQSWIAYMFSLKQDPQVRMLMASQKLKPRPNSIGSSGLKWETQWWEQWTEDEYMQLCAAASAGSIEDWTEWWEKQDHFDSGRWTDKATSWADKTWTEPEAATCAAQKETEYVSFDVIVPEGSSAGSTLQVVAPDEQLLEVAVPHGIEAGSAFSVSYETLQH